MYSTYNFRCGCIRRLFSEFLGCFDATMIRPPLCILRRTFNGWSATHDTRELRPAPTMAAVSELLPADTPHHCYQSDVMFIFID
jgi:hypothetical protein